MSEIDVSSYTLDAKKHLDYMVEQYMRERMHLIFGYGVSPQPFTDSTMRGYMRGVAKQLNWPFVWGRANAYKSRYDWTGGEFKYPRCKITQPMTAHLMLLERAHDVTRSTNRYANQIGYGHSVIRVWAGTHRPDERERYYEIFKSFMEFTVPYLQDTLRLP